MSLHIRKGLLADHTSGARDHRDHGKPSSMCVLLLYRERDATGVVSPQLFHIASLVGGDRLPYRHGVLVV